MATDSDKNELLEEHLRLVIEENKRTNLTRIDTTEKGRLLHIEDSLAALPELDAAPQGAVADLGSGGGFPGIPLAVMSRRRVDLVESVGKKARALQRMVDTLGIGGIVSVRNERAEELALEKPGAYAVVTARALTVLPSLLELSAPLLSNQGALIAYKSQDYQKELRWAQYIQEKLGMEYASVRELTLSDGQTRRCIIVFHKVSEPKVVLPRRPGMAQKNPYRK